MLWERIGLPGIVADQRVPAALTWGGYPGGTNVTKGPPVPADHVTPVWFDSHCHLDHGGVEEAAHALTVPAPLAW